jgi:hypothetical protein
MAIACLRFFTGCLPDFMWCISVRTSCCAFLPYLRPDDFRLEDDLRLEDFRPDDLRLDDLRLDDDFRPDDFRPDDFLRELELFLLDDFVAIPFPSLSLVRRATAPFRLRSE